MSRGGGGAPTPGGDSGAHSSATGSKRVRSPSEAARARARAGDVTRTRAGGCAGGCAGCAGRKNEQGGVGRAIGAVRREREKSESWPVAGSKRGGRGAGRGLVAAKCERGCGGSPGHGLHGHDPESRRGRS